DSAPGGADDTAGASGAGGGALRLAEGPGPAGRPARDAARDAGRDAAGRSRSVASGSVALSLGPSGVTAGGRAPPEPPGPTTTTTNTTPTTTTTNTTHAPPIHPDDVVGVLTE
ncbi:hypothetical protein THAOC_21289, partial [Thalassiosira oceanica]